MKKVINFIKDYTFGFILGALIISLTTVYATTIFQASEMAVDTTNMPNIGSNKTVQDTIEILYSKPYCPNGYKCYKKHNTPQVGDYVKMTPTLSYFDTSSTYTGYTGVNFITPNELNLWRVIRINNNGTIEMVSEYVSSDDLYFRGKTGMKNLVGYLNELASKYENSNYTIGSRYMGYNGQTEYLSNTANTLDSTSTTPYLTFERTIDNSYEKIGGGDILYTADTELVRNAIGKLYAYEVGTTNPADYWLASRSYSNDNNRCWYYAGRTITSSGGIGAEPCYYYCGSFYTSSLYARLRPIVILKSDISYTPALGTINNPFVLN